MPQPKPDSAPPLALVDKGRREGVRHLTEKLVYIDPPVYQTYDQFAVRCNDSVKLLNLADIRALGKIRKKYMGAN